MLKDKIKGFTLAEVLVAMAIIGVVAALTVPALTSSTQTKANKLKARKAYAALTAAVDTGIATADYDFRAISQINGAQPSVSDILERALKAKSVQRKANVVGNLPLAGDCSANNAYAAEQYCTLSIRDRNSGVAVTYKLADGSHLILLDTSTASTDGCVSTDNAANNPAAKPCLALIDINGEKEPNNVIQCTSNQPQTTIWSDVPLSTPPATCTIADNAITDIYPILIFDDRIEPATSAAMTILEEE